MKKKAYLTDEDLIRLAFSLTQDERYRLGVGSLLDGLVWPSLVGRTDASRAVAAILRLRHLRAPDGITRDYPISTEPDDAERLRVAADQARYHVMSQVPRLVGLLEDVTRETLIQQAPVLVSGSSSSGADGMASDEPDLVLDALGYRLGTHYRAEALRRLEAAGEVRQSSSHRWNALSRIWPPADAERARSFHRLCFLSMLDRVVSQRFLGMPSALWMMGFNETTQGRIALGQRLADGARAWLQARSKTLRQARSGDEAELVWVQTGFMFGRRPIPRLPLPEWLRDELDLTVLPAVLARLGRGEQGANFFRRAIADREQRWIFLERKRRAEQKKQGIPVGPLPRGLDITSETRSIWRRLPSFESDSLRSTFDEGLVPVAKMRIRTLLRDVLPHALTLREIYDHAQLHWPVELHSLPLLENACTLLVCAQEAAQNRVLGPERSPGKKNWLLGFKAISVERDLPPITAAYRANLSNYLQETLHCLALADEGEAPFVDTSRVLLPRKDYPAYLEFLRKEREAERDRTNLEFGLTDDDELVSIGLVVVTFESVKVFV